MIGRRTKRRLKSYSSLVHGALCPDSATIFGAAGCQMRITPSCGIVHEVNGFEAGGIYSGSRCCLFKCWGCFCLAIIKGYVCQLTSYPAASRLCCPSGLGAKAAAVAGPDCGHNSLRSVNMVSLDIAQHPRSCHWF